ncbi:CDP-alcohol phosphatidyltransferase family protein [Plantactinospora sp. KBS50]|uniref:CDP-alcohol phosphatidyltransferase family protein n=1 Tax=Plantactinospora sp. KBS50 TaxID=2024580 RepID=UPI000BAAAEC1|nr:CDP-alcohol phosphatidyltransferase family protein [Plantactinospora sp. KBS50]ASW56052.1 CDP-alcohol phosphatidyltransferase [Plantactinospora sp. KBS50]
MVGTPMSWNEYATTWSRLHGGFDPRAATPVVRGWIRSAYLLGYVLGRLHVSPGAVTAAGVVICLAVPVTAAGSAAGALVAAGLVLLAGVADSADGAVAVVTGRASRLGYVYDSLADRVGEGAWLAAFWLVGAPGPLVVLAGGISWLHEYVRARAVSAGMKEIGTVTVGERPTRVAVAVVGLLVAGVAGLVEPDLAAGAMTVVTAIWVLLAGFGIAQLLSVVRRSLR